MRGSRDRPPQAPQPRESIKEAAPFGSTTYSAEEVLAEMATSYMCGITGIENRASLRNAQKTAYARGSCSRTGTARRLTLAGRMTIHGAEHRTVPAWSTGACIFYVTPTRS